MAARSARPPPCRRQHPGPLQSQAQEEPALLGFAREQSRLCHRRLRRCRERPDRHPRRHGLCLQRDLGGSTPGRPMSSSAPSMSATIAPRPSVRTPMTIRPRSTARSAARSAGNLLSDNAKPNDIDQDNYSLAGKLQQGLGARQDHAQARLCALRRSPARDRKLRKSNSTAPQPRFTGDLTQTRVADKEDIGRPRSTQFDIGEHADIVIGGFTRRTRIATPTSGRCASVSTCRSPWHGWNASSRRTPPASPSTSRRPRPSRAGSTASRRIAASPLP